MLPWWCFVFVWMTLCTFYILLYTSACGEATCDELSIFMRLSLLPPALLCCCQYVKGTKQILIAVCVVEFSYLHSNVLICKLQFCSVNVFTVFLYFLPNYSGNHRCQLLFFFNYIYMSPIRVCTSVFKFTWLQTPDDQVYIGEAFSKLAKYERDRGKWKMLTRNVATYTPRFLYHRERVQQTRS